MDISADKYNSDGTQPDAVPVVLPTIKGIVRRLIGFFTLTEENRLEAGIYMGKEERDE